MTKKISMVIIILFSVIVAGAIYYLNDKLICKISRVDKAKADLGSLHTTLKIFKLDTSRYPTNAEGLEILVKSSFSLQIPGYHKMGYLKKIPMYDPWNNKYHYYFYGNREGELQYDLWSYGSDGKLGGSSENAIDIRNIKY